MEFLKLIQKRRACHHFIPEMSIDDKDLIKIIEIAAMSPSGYNAQPWEFVIIREKNNISKAAEIAFNQAHVADASALIIVLGDMNIGRNVDTILEDWVKLGYCTKEEVPVYRNSIAKVRSPEKRKQMALRNSMLACMTLIFAAENMGYATCPIMGFSQWQMEEFIKMPKDRCLALLVAIGYEDKGKELQRLPRKSIEEMIYWEHF